MHRVTVNGLPLSTQGEIALFAIESRNAELADQTAAGKQRQGKLVLCSVSSRNATLTPFIARSA